MTPSPLQESCAKCPNEDKGLLRQIAEFCNRSNDNYFEESKNSSHQDIEQDLIAWIEKMYDEIVTNVIPGDFWDNNGLTKPTKVSSLCPDETGDNSSLRVLLVVLWASCSKDCSYQITQRLTFDANGWRNDDSFKEIDWLAAYTKYICECVKYSRKQTYLEATKENKKEMIDGRSVLLDAYALSQAVYNSSQWYGLLNDKRAPDVLMGPFMTSCITKNPTESRFHGSVTALSVFSVNRSVVEYVSVKTWYCRLMLFRFLAQLAKLTPMVELSQGIKKMRVDTSNHDERKRKVEDLARTAAGKLDLSTKDDRLISTLGAFSHFLNTLLLEMINESMEIRTEHMPTVRNICAFIVRAIDSPNEPRTEESRTNWLKELLTISDKSKSLFPDVHCLKAVMSDCIHPVKKSSTEEVLRTESVANRRNSTSGKKKQSSYSKKQISIKTAARAKKKQRDTNSTHQNTTPKRRKSNSTPTKCSNVSERRNSSTNKKPPVSTRKRHVSPRKTMPRRPSPARKKPTSTDKQDGKLRRSAKNSPPAKKSTGHIC